MNSALLLQFMIDMKDPQYQIYEVSAENFLAAPLEFNVACAQMRLIQYGRFSITPEMIYLFLLVNFFYMFNESY